MVKDRNVFIEAWIDFHKAEPESEAYDEKFWAWEHFNDLAYKQPEEALNVIVDTLRKDSSDLVVSNLAAGPLEELLSENGNRVIERIERLARSDEAFANLLGGVWRNSIAEDIWKRIEAVRKVTW